MGITWRWIDLACDFSSSSEGSDLACTVCGVPTRAFLIACKDGVLLVCPGETSSTVDRRRIRGVEGASARRFLRAGDDFVDVGFAGVGAAAGFSLRWTAFGFRAGAGVGALISSKRGAKEAKVGAFLSQSGRSVPELPELVSTGGEEAALFCIVEPSSAPARTKGAFCNCVCTGRFVVGSSKRFTMPPAYCSACLAGCIRVCVWLDVSAVFRCTLVSGFGDAELESALGERCANDANMGIR